MKTTIELPDHLMHRAKIEAAKRRTTLRTLVQRGLEQVLREEQSPHPEALARLREGIPLGGQALSREEVHGR